MKIDPAQIKATTQEHLDVLDISSDIVLFKSGACCLVLQTTTINFGLLSETEQDAIIYAYASFLNSLSFPVQILIRSQKKDVTGYIKALTQKEQNTKNPLLKKRMTTYRRFVEYIVRENEVLDKNFFIIVPFSPLEAGIGSAGLMKKSKNISPKNRAWIMDKAKNALAPKKDHIVRQLSRIGLKIKQLNNEELIRLFFIAYNPEAEGHTLLSTQDYQSFAVQPSISNHVDNNKENKNA